MQSNANKKHFEDFEDFEIWTYWSPVVITVTNDQHIHMVGCLTQDADSGDRSQAINDDVGRCLAGSGKAASMNNLADVIGAVSIDC